MSIILILILVFVVLLILLLLIKTNANKNVVSSTSVLSDKEVFDNTSVLSDKDVLPKENEIEHQLKLYTGSITNPYIGWASDAHNLDAKQPHTLIFANVSWSSIEPSKGFYDFKSMENDIHYQYWKQKNVKLILRIYLDYPRPEMHMDIPNWLYEESNHQGISYDGNYGKGYSPEYSNQCILKHHGELIQQLAARYDNDPEIAFVEIGSIGHWGEWHTGKNGGVKMPFPSTDVSDKYIKQYIDAFKHVKLMVRRPLKIAKDKKLGLFNDCFGDVLQTQDCFIKWYNNGYLDSMTNDMQPAMPDFWKVSPSGGEVANYPGTQYFDDSCINTTLKQLEQSHTSWLGPSAPIYANSNLKNSSNLDLVRDKMGYKYYASSVKVSQAIVAGKNLPFTFKIKNIGIAPMYYNWKFKVILRNQEKEIAACRCNADITKWLPDSENAVSGFIKIPENLPKGNYSLCYSIVDPSTGNPGINFANTNRLSDGSYKAVDLKAE